MQPIFQPPTFLSHYFDESGKKINLTIDLFSSNLDLQNNVSRSRGFAYISGGPPPHHTVTKLGQICKLS